MPSATSPEPRKRRSGCPTCGNTPVADFQPFCSRGCRDRDLLLWFGEGHRIPGKPAETDGDES